MRLYEVQQYFESLAKKALKIINAYELTARSHGGSELYINKFENALQDLNYLKTSYDPMMAKMNLSKIERCETWYLETLT